MWKALGESVAGTSHLAVNGECQDAVALRILGEGDGQILIFALSDGAGSARYASDASKLCVEGFCRLAEKSVTDPAETVDLLKCCEELHGILMERAKELEVAPRELAATVIGGVVTPNRAWFIHIGDGCIIREKDGGYHAVTWPDSGEFVNTTVFLTSPDWKERAQCRVYDEPVTGIAAFTDGLQELVLEHANRSVHQPFFPGMMARLREPGDSFQLAQPLRDFLASAPVNERTDDDKTLLLACRVS